MRPHFIAVVEVPPGTQLPEGTADLLTGVDDRPQPVDADLFRGWCVAWVGGEWTRGDGVDVKAVQRPVAVVVGDDVEGGIRGELRLEQRDSRVGRARQPWI